MTADEVRQLEGLSRAVGEQTKAVMDGAIAIGKMQEQIRTLFEGLAREREEEIRYRDNQDRRCNERHQLLQVRADQYDQKQSGLLGFESKMGGIVAGIAILSTMMGAFAAFGRILGVW